MSDIMKRKVRHPYQILDISELVIGREYYFISISQWTNFVGAPLAFGGVIDDSWLTANKRGYDLDNVPSDQMSLDMFLDLSLIIHKNMFTIHNDGLCHGPAIHVKQNYPILQYWRKNRDGWDNLSTYFGDQEPGGPRHTIAVPRIHWEKDSKMHIVDWENPDDTIERIGSEIVGNENVADWEQRMKAKKHDAMRKMLGF